MPALTPTDDPDAFADGAPVPGPGPGGASDGAASDGGTQGGDGAGGSSPSGASGDGPTPAHGPRPRGARFPARAPNGATPKAEEEEDELIDPEVAQTPLPEVAELHAAMVRAFQGEAIGADVLARYAHHARLVLEGNRRLNLTAILDPLEMAVKHYLDCWRATRFLPLLGKTVLDLGSGGGFPGMPTALCEPQSRVVLLDSRQKRVAFVQETIDAMGVPNASAVWARGEEHLARNSYDVVFVRALSSVRENVRLLRKVRHRFSDLVMFKGPSWSREARAAEREAERLGFRLDTVWEYELPLEMGSRALLVFRGPGAR